MRCMEDSDLGDGHREGRIGSDLAPLISRQSFLGTEEAIPALRA
jgi:hypothetical protein